jgi:hypothetical protein
MTASAVATRAPQLSPTDTGACGEYRGYSRHLRKGEQPCPACTDAKNRARQQLRNGTRVTPALRPCGTDAAYKRHVAHGEEACAACKRAHADTVAAWSSGEEPPRPVLTIVPATTTTYTTRQAAALAAVRAARRRGSLADRSEAIEVLRALDLCPAISDDQQPANHAMKEAA